MSKEGPLNQMPSVVVRAKERLQSYCRDSVIVGTLKSLLQNQDSNYNKLLLHLCIPVPRSNFGTL